MLNSIVYGNGRGDAFHVSDRSWIQVASSDIEGGWDGAGIIDVPPMFVGPALLDYHLQVGSPCVDTGSNAGASTHDYEGQPRPYDGDGVATADMGADEFWYYEVYLPRASN